MSGGRVEFGLGTGWFDAEHAAYGMPFPALGDRFAIFEEQLAIITGLWETPDGETFSYSGTHYTVTDSPALPKPAQRPRPPVIIGGHGAEADAPSRGRLRRRVQRGLRRDRGHECGVRPGARRCCDGGQACLRR